MIEGTDEDSVKKLENKAMTVLLDESEASKCYIFLCFLLKKIYKSDSTIIRYLYCFLRLDSDVPMVKMSLKCFTDIVQRYSFHSTRQYVW